MIRTRTKNKLARCILLALFAVSGVVNAQGDYDKPFVLNSTYDDSVPHPDGFLGYPLGSRMASHQEVYAYYQSIANALPNASLSVYGHTHEGRELIYLLISSQENMDGIDTIKAAIQKLSDPRRLASDREANRIIADTPAIAWMSYGIHGDEVSSSDAALWLAYQLAAGQDETTQSILENTVVIIDPMQNPDGRERIRNIHQAFRGYVQNPDVQSVQFGGVWPWGRGNHYWFDLNRDFFILAHPESRARVKAFQEWCPQFLVDSHEMGPLDTYLFSPPREPINHNIPDNFHKWIKVFAEDQAKAFDRHGWSYYSREWFEDWYPGYSFWVAYTGTISVLYEQATVQGASVRRPDGTTMTYPETVHHQITSSLANLTTVAQNREQLLSDYYQVKKQTTAPLKKDEIQYYCIEPGKNPSLEQELIEKLTWQGIECYPSSASFKAKKVTDLFGKTHDERVFPKGTWVIPTRQPQKMLLNAILEFDPKLSDEVLADERFHLEKKNQSRMYDWTGWSMGHAYGVAAYYSRTPLRRSTELGEAGSPSSDRAPQDEPQYGYIISCEDFTATKAVTRLLEKGVQIRCAEQPFQNEGRSYPRGTFLIRKAENPTLSVKDVQDVATQTNARIDSANTALSLDTVDLGGRYFDLLAVPRVGVFTQSPIHPYSYGYTWHFLDEKYRSRMSALDINLLSRADLRKYNLLILPSAFNPAALNRAIGEPEVKKLRQWIENGGTLIVLGNSVNTVAREKDGLSAVRNRADVLDQLDVYREFAEREQKALAASANQDDIYAYDGEKAGDEREGQQKEEKQDSSPPGEGKPAKKDKEALKRQDDWEKRFSPNGALLKVRLDPHHWLTYGVNDPLAVMVNGANSFYAKPPVAVPIRFVDKRAMRASGLLWPEARNRLETSVYVTQESVGRGQIILFPFEPHQRGYFPATQRILWNAIFLGPGLGARQPIPW